MTARQQWSIVGLIVLVLGGALFTASRLLEDQLYPVSVGSKAPNFRAQTGLRAAYAHADMPLFLVRNYAADLTERGVFLDEPGIFTAAGGFSKTTWVGTC